MMQSGQDGKLGCLRLRGPCGAQDEFTLAAIAQNLRRLAKLVVSSTDCSPIFAILDFCEIPAATTHF